MHTKSELPAIIRFLIPFVLICITATLLILFTPDPGYPDEFPADPSAVTPISPTPEDVFVVDPIVVPTTTPPPQAGEGAVPSPAPASASADCLNCAPPVMDLKGGVCTSFSPMQACWWATLDGSVPITFGDDVTGKARTICRGGARVHIGMETGDGEVIGGDESVISKPEAWQRVDAEAWLEIVAGRRRYPSGHEVLTSLMVAAGGAAPLNSAADVDPRVTTRAYGGFRIHETKSGADFVAGLGWDRALEAYRQDPDGLDEGFKTLHLILRTSLPVPKTEGTTWFVGETALDPRTGNARVEVGLGFSPGAVLRKLGKKG